MHSTLKKVSGKTWMKRRWRNNTWTCANYEQIRESSDKRRRDCKRDWRENGLGAKNINKTAEKKKNQQTQIERATERDFPQSFFSRDNNNSTFQFVPTRLLEASWNGGWARWGRGVPGTRPLPWPLPVSTFEGTTKCPIQTPVRTPSSTGTTPSNWRCSKDQKVSLLQVLVIQNCTVSPKSVLTLQRCSVQEVSSTLRPILSSL